MRQHLVEESSTIWSGPAEQEKEEEQKGHQAMRTSFLPGSFTGPSDGKAASNDANSNAGAGGRLETSGTPAIASAPGPKPASSTATQGQAALQQGKPGAISSTKGGQTAENAGSQAGPARGDLRQAAKPKLLASGPGAAEHAQQNMVSVEYRDAPKIEESERARLLRILKKQAVVKGSAGKRLTEEERAAEMEKIERRGMQDLLKKTIIEEEYQIDRWHFDTLG